MCCKRAMISQLKIVLSPDSGWSDFSRGRLRFAVDKSSRSCQTSDAAEHPSHLTAALWLNFKPLHIVAWLKV